ncbi:SUKH-3 domain-containing protein [Actinoplanes sp. NPDC048796]|uniref:SUKH-3 domain-containing protein n=1 Tax=Actinoplanes sp. NPDC048796 TaxID=3155640 RepID=UPI00340D207D
MGDRFPRGVDRALRRAGWFPGRRVDTTPWRDAVDGITMHPAARAFLAEFGGLAVDVHGFGRTAAKEPFEVDPALCAGEEDRFREWSEILGRSLYPLGELDHGRFFLGIDDRGSLYLVVDWLAVFDGPADAGLIALCRGVMPRPVRQQRCSGC